MFSRVKEQPGLINAMNVLFMLDGGDAAFLLDDNGIVL